MPPKLNTSATGNSTLVLGKGSKNQNGNSRWFEMDVTLGPNNLAMFKVISTTIYT